MWKRLFSATASKDESDKSENDTVDDSYYHTSLLENQHPLNENNTDIDTEVTVPINKKFREEEDNDDDEVCIENGNTKYKLEEGDHIYSWRAMGTYSHHGIVLSVTKVSVVILDFYASKNKHDSSNDNGSNSTFEDSLRIIHLDQWKALYGRPRKVAYSAPYLKRSIYRSGTCCSVESHPNFMVVARAKFLLANSPTSDNTDSSYIPPYHALHSNSETLSVWCKTGHYSTLQVADFLHLTWAGQAKSTFTIGAFLSAQTVQVPAAGVWGYMGFTTKVGLLATQPLLLPALLGYGILTVGTPMYMLRKCHSMWSKYEETLNELFWSGGKREGDVLLNDLILDCLDHYYHGNNDNDDKSNCGKEGNEDVIKATAKDEDMEEVNGKEEKEDGVKADAKEGNIEEINGKESYQDGIKANVKDENIEEINGTEENEEMQEMVEKT